MTRTCSRCRRRRVTRNPQMGRPAKYCCDCRGRVEHERKSATRGAGRRPHRFACRSCGRRTVRMTTKHGGSPRFCYCCVGERKLDYVASWRAARK